MTPPAVLQRLVEAVNLHDLDALTACFAPDFLSETPAHPDRNFRGREQVRANWSEIFRAVPDIQLAVIRCADDGDPRSTALHGARILWAEQEFTGTRVDGGRHLMRGVTIFGVRRDQLASVRFYIEPVQADGVAIGASVRATLSAHP
jgi:ketosteroid isomerase-like protein